MRQKQDFWHVVVGKNFTFSVTNEELQGPLVLSYNGVKIAVFRQQGTKRTVNWKNLGTWVGNVVLVLVIFMTLITVVKCDSESKSWICEHQTGLQFVALTVILARVGKKLVAKIQERKTKLKTR